MKGNKKMIEALNDILTGELTGGEPVLRALQDVRKLGLRAARQEEQGQSRSVR